MRHVRDVRATSHDDHDTMLVAALAAGDLAGTDRDQAVTLIQGCAECATLHDDLRAIARATAALPPPMTMPARDFRLSPQQAAELRPRGWRRLIPAGLGAATLTRPLGVGLATFGLIGLLVTNLPLGFSMGSSAAAPAPYGAGGGAVAPVTADSNAAASAGSDLQAERPAASAAYPAASAAASVAAAPSARPESLGGTGTGATVAGSAAPSAVAVPPAGSGKVSVAGGSGPVATAEPRAAPDRDLSQSVGPSAGDIRNIVFVAAILAGLGLLIAARRARRLA